MNPWEELAKECQREIDEASKRIDEFERVCRRLKRRGRLRKFFGLKPKTITFRLVKDDS